MFFKMVILSLLRLKSIGDIEIFIFGSNAVLINLRIFTILSNDSMKIIRINVRRYKFTRHLQLASHPRVKPVRPQCFQTCVENRYSVSTNPPIQQLVTIP